MIVESFAARPPAANRRRWAAAVVVGMAAFALYHSTLLPDFDFGDTGFFQTRVGSAALTPRDGYPLYFAIGAIMLRTSHLPPARALNLASAIEGAIACGLLVLVCAELSGSLAASIAAALLFSVSYTFWSQAIIAEVYALHAIFVALATLLLLAWAERPTMARLAAFFAVYAVGFGNHLSMILLLPGFTVFLLASAARGWRSMFAPRVVLLALAIAAGGALQYAWNFRGLWEWPNQPPRLGDALGTFWFDVTKSDWRETMVLRLPGSMLVDRLAMYRFDLFQQFGWAVVLAPIGLAALLVRNWRRGVLIALLYLVNVGFAFTYNVGDTHVFYLPSHLVVAMMIAVGIASLASVGRRAVVGMALVVVAVAGIRAYRDFPALDRTEDRRPAAVLDHLTHDLDDRRAIFLADLNWQLVNGLAYYGKVVRPDLAYDWISHVLLYAPALVRDNFAMGRDVTLTDRAAALVRASYGPLLPIERDPHVDVPRLSDIVRGLPGGTRYVLCVLKPSRELAIDVDDVRAAVSALTAGTAALPPGDYATIAGSIGAPPDLVAAGMRPFTRSASVAGTNVEVRMESWLAFDTIRRMGFGQVVAHHRHTLIVERGISFAAFDADGRPIRTAYLASIFAPQPRFLVRR